MDRVEQVAIAIHDGWWEYQLDRGVQLGPRNAARTNHPHMLPWCALDDESRNQDRFIAAVLLAKGFKITPKAIHEAWRLWEKIHGNEHPHDKPYKEAHVCITGRANATGFLRVKRQSPREHAAQVRRIEQVIAKWKKR